MKASAESARRPVPGGGHARAAIYEIRVGGHLDDHWSHWLGDVAVSRHDDGSSTLVASVVDQSHLHGMLSQLRDIGAKLLAVRTLEDVTDEDSRMPALQQALRTERLTLRAATEADVEATFAYRRLDSIGMWLTQICSEADEYRAMFTEESRLTTTLIIELDGEPIGDLMLRVEDSWAQAEVREAAVRKQAELGWVLHPDHSGRGYATEAVRELMRYCFEELGIHRVVATCFADNVESWRLMERLGMRRETYAVRESMHRSGQWMDTLTYALLDDEYPGAISS